MTNYYIKGASDKWVRPAGWPALPTLTSADNKMAGVYAIYENKTNRLAIQHTSGSANNTIDWGDGTSTTWTGAALQVKLYNYSTITAPVLVDSAGFNYKPILIGFKLNSGTIGPLLLAQTIAAAGQVVQSNWLDVLISWSAGFSWPLAPRLMQRLNVLKINAANISGTFQGFTSLQVLEGTLLGPGNTNNYTTIQTAFSGIGPLRLGDIEVNGVGTPINASTIFQSSFIKSIGNITLNNVGSCDTFLNTSRELKSVGNITATAVTNFSAFFNSCTRLQTVGTINIGTTAGAFSANGTFANCPFLREVVFVDAGRITVTTNMFLGCLRLRKVRLPNIAISFTIAGCDLERAELVDLFNDLATVVTPQTITITGNPGVPDLTLADENIAVNKGWSVTKV
jgi:hypothetical protein